MLRRSLTRFSAAAGVGGLQPYEFYKDVQSAGIGRSMHLFMDRGEGTYLYSKDNKKYLDFGCGIGVTNLGHCHPRLVKVVQNQAAKLWHGQVAFGVTTAMAEMIDELQTVVPPALNSLFFCSTGAETIEATLRMARNHTKRQNVVVVQGSYHGRTNATLAMTTSKYSYGIGCKPYMPGVSIVPCPYPTQLKVDNATPVATMVQQCLGILEDTIFQNVHPSEIAMILVEPVMGEGGYLPQPTDYITGIQAICKKHGILFALDEVQTGFGRTGTFFTATQIGVTPDFLLFAKGIANGLPLAGVATTKAISASQPPGTQGGTYSGNALACASAAEVIRIMRDEGVLANSVERGNQLRQGLLDLMAKHPWLPLQEVRGRGLMLALQFMDGVPAGISQEVVNQCFARGMLLLNTSKFEVLRFIPPLTVTKDQIVEGLEIFESALLGALDAKKYVHDGKRSDGFMPCCNGSPCNKLEGSTFTCRSIIVRK